MTVFWRLRHSDYPPTFVPGGVREFCRDEGPERPLFDGTETSSYGPDYLQVASSGYGTVAAPEPSDLVLASLAVILLGSRRMLAGPRPARKYRDGDLSHPGEDYRSVFGSATWPVCGRQHKQIIGEKGLRP